MTARSENVIDQIRAVLARHVHDGSTNVAVPHHPSRRDLRVFGLSADSHRARREIEELDCVERLTAGKSGRVGVRLRNACIEELGSALERGSDLPLQTDDLHPALEVTVDFCDPNATKALHTGHLRNLALGNALVGLFQAGGARVRSQSQVGDIGRSMGEAMAGYVEFGGVLTAEPAAKGDHVIGRCYSRYVREMADPGPLDDKPASDPALAREDLDRDDLASDLMQRWHRSEPDALDVWRVVRGMVMAGQEETLSRLGITFDSLQFESDFMDPIQEVGDQLLTAGLAERAESGAVLYMTGDESYPCLVLRRPDGHSTQNLRYLALWHATRSELAATRSIEVMGDEWQPLAVYGDRLLRALAPEDVAHPSRCVLHGMVDLAGTVVKSSQGAPWLIDEMLDDLVGNPRVQEAVEGRDGAMGDVVAAVALGCCLGCPPASRLSLSPEALLDLGSNPGWAVALAALKAWEPCYDGEPDPDAEDREYRFLVTQSQVHRMLVERACAELDPSHLVSFHSHLGRWFLRHEASPRLARVMRTVTSAGLSSMGLPRIGCPSDPVGPIVVEAKA